MCKPIGLQPLTTKLEVYDAHRTHGEGSNLSLLVGPQKSCWGARPRTSVGARDLMVGSAAPCDRKLNQQLLLHRDSKPLCRQSLCHGHVHVICRVYDRKDEVAGIFSSLCALGVAFFTTAPDYGATQRQQHIGTVHYIFVVPLRFVRKREETIMN